MFSKDAGGAVGFISTSTQEPEGCFSHFKGRVKGFALYDFDTAPNELISMTTIDGTRQNFEMGEMLLHQINHLERS
jgi:hypothetical protein